MLEEDKDRDTTFNSYESVLKQLVGNVPQGVIDEISEKLNANVYKVILNSAYLCFLYGTGFSTIYSLLETELGNVLTNKYLFSVGGKAQ